MQTPTSSVNIVLAQHCNGFRRPRLFGGQLMAWIDIVASVAARRFTHSAITTVCVDNLNFLKPVYLGETLVQKAWVTWTGKTSLEVRVDSYVEHLSGVRELVNTAYLVFVALDEEEKPIPVPALIPETEEERIERDKGEERRKIRLGRM